MSFGGGQPNAATPGLNFCRAADIAQIDAAAAGCGFHLAIAMAHHNAAAPGLESCSLIAGLNLDAAAAGFGHNFPTGVMDLDRSAASVQAEVAADASDFD